MFSKIFSSFTLANAFKSLLFKRISNPLQSARIISLFLDIKNVFGNGKEQADSICETLDLITNFKNKYPKDFEKVFEILKEFFQNYEQNPDEIKQNIKEFLKNKKNKI